MVNQHDIKTKTILVSNAATDLGLGVVPNGMKRWVTFIRFSSHDGVSTPYFMLGSGITATDISTTNMKFRAIEDVPHYNYDNCPKTPDPDHPLFSIAAGKYLTAYDYNGTSAIFIQYYDE